MEAPSAGLLTVVHTSRDYDLTYSNPEKFLNFLKHKDAEWVWGEHLARGLPENGFKERYTRYAKSLIAVGDGAGQDIVAGLEIEIVALTNPYTDDLSNGMMVQVLYQDAPRANAQLEVFERTLSGSISVFQLQTDGNGEITVPVTAGHEYLLDSVVLRAIEPEAEGGSVWASLWASLTFKVPN